MVHKDSSSNAKRRYSREGSSKESSYSDDDTENMQSKLTGEKKIKERTSPQTSDDEGRTQSMDDQQPSTSKWNEDEELEKNMSKTVLETDQEIQSTKSGNRCSDEGELLGGCTDKTKRITEVEVKDNEDNTYYTNTESLKQKIQEIEETWDEIRPKPIKDTSSSSNQFMKDFLGEEVSKDEAEALEALRSYWLNTVVKKAVKPNNQIPEEDTAFYTKYCDGTREMSLEATLRLMSLPYVITVTLKSVPKIEIVVSDVPLALQASPELLSDDFEVTEAMGMHLF